MKLSLRWKVLSCTAFLLLVAAVSVPPKVFAFQYITNFPGYDKGYPGLNPDPDSPNKTIPSSVRTYLAACNEPYTTSPNASGGYNHKDASGNPILGYSPAFKPWIGDLPPNSANQDNIPVNYGDKNKQLGFYIGAVVCFKIGAKTQDENPSNNVYYDTGTGANNDIAESSTSKILSTSATSPNGNASIVMNDSLAMKMDAFGNTQGTYRSASKGFTITPLDSKGNPDPAGFKNASGSKSITYTIKILSSGINTFKHAGDGTPGDPTKTIYSCVGGNFESGADPVNDSEFDKCNRGTTTLTFTFDITPPHTDVQGTLRHYPDGAGVGGVTINSCGASGSAIKSAAATGDYHGDVTIGAGFCLDPVASTVPAGYDGPFIRPYEKDYDTCPGRGAAIVALPPPNPPDYCSNTSYQEQVAGVDAKASGPPYNAAQQKYDRSIDYGYDFVVTDIPPPTCNNVALSLASGDPAGAAVEPGVSYEIKGTFKNNAVVVSISRPDFKVAMSIKNQAGNVLFSSADLPYGTAGPGASTSFTGGFRNGIPVDPVGVYSVLVTISGPHMPNVTCNTNYTIAAKPYLRVYGGDVLAGASVEADPLSHACNINDKAGIAAYSKTGVDSGAGAGTQYAAQAMNLISGFSTAITRPSGSPPVPIFGLAFANNTPAQGGKFGSAPCTIDYFATNTDTTPRSFDGTVSGHYYTNGPLDINTGPQLTINRSVRAAVYVKGDARIGKDVFYQSGPWTLNEIPAYYLIVKGDIYIDASVSNLDGVYIAQKRANGSGGNIYTCAHTNDPSNSYLYKVNLGLPSALSAAQKAQNATYIDNCNNKKLVVNGAFIAQSVKFQRTLGTLKDSTNTEVYSSGNTAEAFLYTPELWLLPPPITNGKNVKYNSVTGLPPIL